MHLKSWHSIVNNNFLEEVLSYQEEPFVRSTDLAPSTLFKEDLAFVMSKLDYRSSESAIR